MVKKYACPICNLLVRSCDKLGDPNFCEEKLEQLKKGEITAEELQQAIEEKFGSEPFGDTVKETADEMVKEKEEEGEE